MEAAVEKLLDKGAFLNLWFKERTVVASRNGRFWLTRPRDSEDYFLIEGEALCLPKGPWLLQALNGGTVHWTDDIPLPQKLVFGRPQIEEDCLPSVSGI
jgi:hypothetical protein